MVAIKIIVTVSLIAFMVYLLNKKFNGPTVLLCLGLATLAVTTLITGTSAVSDGNTGSLFIDLFELVRAKLKSNISGSILLVMCVFGYIGFMKAIKADEKMVYICTKPLSKIKNKYVLIAGAIIIATLVKLVIAGHSGTTALLVATLYPILVAAGVSKESAAAAVVIGGTIDIGPAEPNAAIFLSDEFVGSTDASLADFFLEYQLLPGIVVTVVVVILSIMANRYFDKKDGVIVESADVDLVIRQTEARIKDVPGFYAIFPVLPLLLIVIFSFSDRVTLSAHNANIMCFVLTFIIHLIINRKNFKESFNVSSEFFKGMGNAVASVGCLIVTGTVFSAGIEKVGGIKAILDITTNSNFSGAISLLIVAFIAMFIAFACATGTPAMTTVLTIMPQLVASTGLHPLTIAAPIIMSSANGRALAMVCPAVLITSGYSGVSPVTMFKRNIIPAVGGTITAVVATLVFCA